MRYCVIPQSLGYIIVTFAQFDMTGST